MKESPFQTAGPYVHIGCMPNFCGIEGIYQVDPGTEMLSNEVAGERIALRGIVYDGAGEPLKDAMIEIWQADVGGRYARSTSDVFMGWGRQPSDYETGEWIFQTIKPGRVPFGDGRMMAPHVTVWIVARGINNALQTRLYFPDEDNTGDPVLERVDPARIDTLVARQASVSDYRFDIHLQGDDETVFFDI